MTEVAVNEEAMDNPATKTLHIHAEPKKEPAEGGWHGGAGFRDLRGALPR